MTPCVLSPVLGLAAFLGQKKIPASTRVPASLPTGTPVVDGAWWRPLRLGNRNRLHGTSQRRLLSSPTSKARYADGLLDRLLGKPPRFSRSLYLAIFLAA